MYDEADSEGTVRGNSVWLHGVDNLSTNDVKKYVKQFTEEFFRVEWINDSSLNIAFDLDSQANDLLRALTQDKDQEFDSLTEREVVQYDPTKPDHVMKARLSTLNDKKVKNAALYSRYYLFNPESAKGRDVSDRSRSNGYRDREPRKRQPINDDEDLFPEKVTEGADTTNNRRTETSDVGDDVDLLSHLDKPSDNLGQETQPAHEDLMDEDQEVEGVASSGGGDLLSRIGTVERKKKGTKGDLLDRIG